MELEAGGDWHGLISSIYERPLSWEAWGEGLIDRLSRIVRAPVLGIQLLRLTPQGQIGSVELFDVSGSLRELKSTFQPVLAGFDVQTVRSYFFPRGSINPSRSAFGGASPSGQSAMVSALPGLETMDGCAVIAHPEAGCIVAVFMMGPDEMRLGPMDRAILTRLAFHLESSVRLHRRPESLVAVVGLEGKIDYMRDPATDRSRYKEVAARFRSSAGLGRDMGIRSLLLFPGLISGRLSAVERKIGSRRVIYFLENPPQRQPLQALSAREHDVLSLVCQGHSSKATAYALGVAESTVSVSLERAAKKIGLSSRLELVRVAAMLTRDPRARFVETALTTAERDVLDLLRRGLTNDEIARIRCRSVRTIANQVASLLNKTGASNRRVLAVTTPEH